MKKQRLLSILLVICLAVSMFSVSAGAIDVSNFKDVKESDWFYDYVKFVTSKGYFEGVSDTEFAPNATMTRAMFVTVLARIEGVKVDNTKSAFSDVPVNTWYTGAVAWAAENKIVDGITDTEFYPNTAVTREQMCAIMERYINNCDKTVKGEAKIDSFKDVEEVSDWAAKSVEFCRKLGLIDGFEDGTFRPTETSTRAQVATVDERLCEVVVNEGSNEGSSSGTTGGLTPPTYTDYIFNAIDAAGKDSVELIRDVVTDLAGYTNLSVNSAITVRDFAASAYANSNGGRPQNITATVALSSTLIDEISTIAITYATDILGGTMSLNDVKTIVRDVLDDIEAEFGIDFSAISRDAIVNAVYNYTLNNVSSIWANFNDGNGKYYTGDVTVSVPGAADVVINVSDATGATFSGNKLATVKSLAVAIAKQAYESINDANNPHSIDANNDGWYEQVGAAANVIFLFSAPANDYADHTDNYTYEYPFTLLLKLDGQGTVQYKFDGGANVKLVVSQVNQDKYEDAVAQAVSAALGNPAIVNTVRDKANELIESYTDLTTGPLASQIPAGIGSHLRGEVEHHLKVAIKAWFAANAGISLTGGTDTGIEGSYLYEKYWAKNPNADALHNDQAFDNLQMICDALVSASIAAEIDALIDDVKDEIDATPGFSALGNTEKATIYATTAKEILVEAFGGSASDYAISVNSSDLTAWENEMAAIVTAKVNAAAPTIPYDTIEATALSYIEGHSYMTYIEQATNLKSFDTMDDVVLGNLATALKNSTVQSYIAAQGASSYLVKVADALGRLPAGASLTLKQNGSTVATVTSAQVAAIQSAATPAAVCNAVADLLNTTGLSTLSISDFAAGMDITASANGRTFTFNFIIEVA